MTDIRASETMEGSRRWPWVAAFWSAAAVGLAALVYVIVALSTNPPQPELKTLARGDMANLVVESTGAPPPSLPFIGADGRETNLARLKGPILIVNLWATWCAPCVREMPTLAKLQAAYPGRILVVPISMDAPKDSAKARAFIAQYPPLPFFQDPGSKLVFAISPPAEGLPTTLIYDKNGRERARLAGGANWSGPDAHAVVESLLAQK
ncbi:MAG TPA: TlpA disulfide reductase family protein [Caulobacteraceae bacterium]|nr:TlpA disulfide reductase family protein [Caulobacteraceae bacterium]